MLTDQDELRDAIEEAITAFDAANHAFGRFVTYVVRPRNQPVPPAVQQVRAGLQEAAISFPEEQTAQAAGEFLEALLEAQQRLAAFLAAPPDGYALEEALAAPPALEEAIRFLRLAVREEPET